MKIDRETKKKIIVLVPGIVFILMLFGFYFKYKINELNESSEEDNILKIDDIFQIKEDKTKLEKKDNSKLELYQKGTDKLLAENKKNNKNNDVEFSSIYSRVSEKEEIKEQEKEPKREEEIFIKRRMPKKRNYGEIKPRKTFRKTISKKQPKEPVSKPISKPKYSGTTIIFDNENDNLDENINNTDLKIKACVMRGGKYKTGDIIQFRILKEIKTLNISKNEILRGIISIKSNRIFINIINNPFSKYKILDFDGLEGISYSVDKNIEEANKNNSQQAGGILDQVVNSTYSSGGIIGSVAKGGYEMTKNVINSTTGNSNQTLKVQIPDSYMFYIQKIR